MVLHPIEANQTGNITLQLELLKGNTVIDSIAQQIIIREPGIKEVINTVKLMTGDVNMVTFELPTPIEGVLSEMNVTASLLMIDSD